jgi:adenylate cyclase class 2
MKNQELEVKFYITDLKRIEHTAQSLGSILTQPRTYESNLRFDTPDKRLQSNLQVLRLRMDSEARLTFKGPAQAFGGARLREEIEFVASDYETARLFLLALGFEVVMVYEKYRTIYDLENVHVTLDELPYGNFLELEGDDPQVLKKISLLLGVNWEAQATGSYAFLFEQLKLEYGLAFRDLTFENFGNLTITPEMLHLRPAD